MCPVKDEKLKMKRKLEAFTKEELQAERELIIKRYYRVNPHLRRRARVSSSSPERKKNRRQSSSDKSGESSPRKKRSFCCCCCCHVCPKKCHQAEKNLENAVQVARMQQQIAAALRSEEKSPGSSSSAIFSAQRQHAPLIDEWKRIAREGFGYNELKELSAKYKVGEQSCLKEFKAPELNVEMRRLVDTMSVQIDEAYVDRQNQFAVQLSMLEKVLGIIVQKGKQSSEVAKLVELVYDIGRNNADIQHAISIARRRSIFAALELNNMDDKTPVEDQLISPKTERMLRDFYLTEAVMAILAKERSSQVASLQEQLRQAKQVAVSTQTTEELGPGEGNRNAGQEMMREGVSTKVEAMQETALQGVTAKIEGARSTQQEAPAANILTPGVPSENDVYPGAKELVRRANAQRGSTREFPDLKDITWATYNKPIRDWWQFCKDEKKDVAQPSPEDVVKFYRQRAERGQTIGNYRSAIKHVVSHQIANDFMVYSYFRAVKKEASS